MNIRLYPEKPSAMRWSWRWLVNIALLAPPIAITLAVLFGLEVYREEKGQTPIFVDNGIETNQYCQQAFGIHPESTGQEFTLNPNQWGWTKGEPGSLCMNVTSFNNKTYSTPTRAPEFSVTWQYPPGPQTAPVHAFPNIKLGSGDDTSGGTVFPATLSSISRIGLEVQWTYGVGNDTVSSTDIDDLEDHDVNANVAVDLFLDADETKAASSEDAKYEVMVWLAALGPATQPIGLSDGAVVNETIDGTDLNGLGQYVLTWVASEPTESFKGDLSPLVDAILELKETYTPTESDYLGYMSLGTEAYSSDTEVTFHVPQLSIDIRT